MPGANSHPSHGEFNERSRALSSDLVQPDAKGAAVSNPEVKDKVAIVTGAAGGLGFGIAARPAEEQAVQAAFAAAEDQLGEVAASPTSRELQHIVRFTI
jgi:hypothetical protein